MRPVTKGALLALALATLPALAHAGLLPPPAPVPGGELPEPLRSLAAWGFGLQRQLNGEMRAHLAALKEGGSIQPALALMTAAFLYGVFHAVGPGHGKVVIGSWLVSRRARVTWGLAACGLSALAQAVVAIAVVAVLAGLAALAPKDILAQAAWLEVGSYGLIAAMGLAMGWNTLRGRHACGHDHSHDHGHACCGHDHHHHHHDEAEDRRTLWAMAAAIGFRPCSGAILVLLFTLANGLFAVGIAATFAMAAGVGLTVSGIGLSALGLNRLLDRGAGRSRHADTLRKALSLAGAGAITLMGVVLLLGAVQGGAPVLTG
ncbi:MAG: ABC transporter [Magnetospirillum sp.]|nr:ABC transporter [Magnetospirillum sp.]